MATEVDTGKVLAVEALIARAITDGRGVIEATDTEIGAALGLALSRFGGTAEGVNEIANFAMRHLTN